MNQIENMNEVKELIERGAHFYVGHSGGKDSQALGDDYPDLSPPRICFRNHPDMEKLADIQLDLLGDVARVGTRRTKDGGKHVVSITGTIRAGSRVGGWNKNTVNALENNGLVTVKWLSLHSAEITITDGMAYSS